MTNYETASGPFAVRDVGASTSVSPCDAYTQARSIR